MDANALMKLSYGLYVLGAEEGGTLTGCIVDAVMQSTVEPPVLVVSCMRKNHTNEVIHRTKRFTLSVLPENVEPFVVANFGFQSGRNANKWGNCPNDLSDGLPILRGCVAYARCRVEQVLELSTHTLFIAHVEDAWQGDGEPLVYADYQARLKIATAKAFQAFKASGAKPDSTTVSRESEAEQPAPADTQPEATSEKTVWRCSLCGYVYDGEVSFEELPEDYTCPLCGQPKSVFRPEPASGAD